MLAHYAAMAAEAAKTGDDYSLNAHEVYRDFLTFSLMPNDFQDAHNWRTDSVKCPDCQGHGVTSGISAGQAWSGMCPRCDGLGSITTRPPTPAVIVGWCANHGRQNLVWRDGLYYCSQCP